VPESSGVVLRWIAGERSMRGSARDDVEGVACASDITNVARGSVPRRYRRRDEECLPIARP
jgi:hypothetical protein